MSQMIRIGHLIYIEKWCLIAVINMVNYIVDLYTLFILLLFWWININSSFIFNTAVSNHVNSDHVTSFSCIDVWNVRQTTSGVYAITVTTSAYHSRRCGSVIWRRQGNGWINTGVWYPTICLISEIYERRSLSFHDSDSSK
jgi:hypothetical protein